MDFFRILVLMLPEIIPVVLGVILGKMKVFKKDAADTLLKFLLYIAFPSVILGNISQEQLGSLLRWEFVAASAVAILGMFAFTYVAHRMFYHRTMRVTAMAALSVSFVSGGIVGIPIMDNLIGLRATLVPVILNTMVSLVTVVPLAIILIRWQSGHKDGHLKTIWYSLVDALENPLVVSAVVGLIIACFNIQLPEWLSTTFSKLGSATFATALFTVGLSIDLRTIQHDIGEIAFLSVLRMVVFSIFAFTVAILFKLPPLLAVPFVMIMSLPTAKSVPAIGVTHHGVFVKESMQIVTLTTILTVFVMPLVVLAADMLWPGIVK